MPRDQTFPLPLYPAWQPPVTERRAGSVPCAGCGWWTRCGGPAHERPDASQPEVWGCFGQCDLECRAGGCDWTCPNNTALWLRRWAEVGGMGAAGRFDGALRAVEAAELPLYVPVIGHGKRRARPADFGTVALSLYEVVGGRRGGGYGLRSGHGAAGLRAAFGLRADCRVILLSVGPDRALERFWQHHRAADISRVLADLGLTGVTTPNFSFFTDAPRTHSLWNRARTLRVAERLSTAGVAVIPHLNASNARDWQYWAGFLREHANVRCVAKEFQTGLRRPEAGRRAFRALADLQQAVGRALSGAHRRSALPAIAGTGFRRARHGDRLAAIHEHGQAPGRRRPPHGRRRPVALAAERHPTRDRPGRTARLEPGALPILGSEPARGAVFLKSGGPRIFSQMAFSAHSHPVANGARPAEALAGLEAAIRQLRDSRRRLETDPASGQSGDDALIYIEAAEMQLKAAHCRLAEAIPRPVPKPQPGTPASGA